MFYSLYLWTSACTSSDMLPRVDGAGQLVLCDSTTRTKHSYTVVQVFLNSTLRTQFGHVYCMIHDLHEPNRSATRTFEPV